jgi:uncharacterized membrane protein YhiD involved in acid resistance
MLDSIFPSAGVMMLPALLLSTLVSLLLGLGIAFLYMYKNEYNKNFVITLALLPAMVHAVILLVNGNVGTGVAVLGAFSLVRFRSLPGGAREIGSIFFAMALGLATGMGYIWVALLFQVIIGGAMLALTRTSFGQRREDVKELKITIPECLEYEGAFDDLFSKYTLKTELVRVKTTTMGSLFELTYHITFQNPGIQKEFLDQLRCRNGNLAIVCGHLPVNREEL